MVDAIVVYIKTDNVERRTTSMMYSKQADLQSVTRNVNKDLLLLYFISLHVVVVSFML